MREEEGGGVGIPFSADCLGDYENLYGPWGGGGGKKKNEPLKKKSSAHPCSVHNECSLCRKLSRSEVYSRLLTHGQGFTETIISISYL